MSLLWIVLAPLAGCWLPAFAGRFGRLWGAWAAGAVTAFALALLLGLAPAVFAGETLRVSWPWLPAAGLHFSLRLDGLAFLFAFLILGIGLLIILYARYYLSPRDPMGRFYAMLMLFMGAMLGIVLAENLLLLAVFWELTSLSSFLLIGYWHHRADSRQGARMAIAVTGGGGLAMLAGFLLLGHIVGSYELTDVLAAREVIHASPLYLPMLLLVVLGAFTKSAQFPFHFWLPAAMAAPTPVSAYLHSAAMVKAGVFLLARLHPALAGSDAWFFLVGGAGLFTLVFAAYSALFKHDLKGLLAYSTVSHLGLITLLFGFGTPTAAVAGVFHIINHATFKASLFMAAGIIDHEAGTRDMRRLSGLWSYMPYTATLAMVAAAAMAGVPLLNGFLSKEMFFTETLALARLGETGWVVPVAATAAAVFSVAYSVRFIHDVFFGAPAADLPRTPHEPPRWMKIPVEVLVALCLLVGILPAVTVGPLLAVAAGAVVGGELPAYRLALWHGFNLPLAMSALALVGGVLVYSQRRRLFRLHDEVLPALSASAVYAALLGALLRIAGAVTGWLENGSLQRYLVFFLIVALAAGVMPFWRWEWGLGPEALTPVDGVSLVAWAVLAAAALGTAVWHRHRLTALILLSVVGLIVALAFVRFSAPDLALTQLSVEMVTIVLLLLALNFLPQRSPAESTSVRRARDAGLAAAAGLGVFALTLAVLTRPFDSISRFHLENSVSGGGGTNVVNVILVDFRGYDTLGEIVVLAIAALVIYALLDGVRISPRPGAEDGTPWARDRYPLMLSMITRPLLPLALLVSFYLLLRGHNQPGGGFIAGLVTAIALIMQYLASGIHWAQQRLRLDYHLVIALGLLLAAFTGIASWLFSAPFLTGTFGHFHLPWIGEVELASAVLFDLGVYFTVVGAVMLILANLGRVSGGEAEAVAAAEEAGWKS